MCIFLTRGPEWNLPEPRGSSGLNDAHLGCSGTEVSPAHAAAHGRVCGSSHTRTPAHWTVLPTRWEAWVRFHRRAFVPCLLFWCDSNVRILFLWNEVLHYSVATPTLLKCWPSKCKLRLSWLYFKDPMDTYCIYMICELLVLQLPYGQYVGKLTISTTISFLCYGLEPADLQACFYRRGRKDVLE